MPPKLRLILSDAAETERPAPFYWPAPWADRKALHFLACWGLLLCLFSPARVTDVDVSIRSQVSRSLWSTGSVFSERGTAVDAGLVWNEHGLGTSFYGIGQSLVFLPFDFAGALLTVLSSNPKTQSALSQLPIALAYVPLAGMCWMYTLWIWFQCWGLSRRESGLASVAFFLTTPALFYSAQSAQEESLVAALGLAALSLTKIALDRGFEDRRKLVWAGFLTGMAVLVRLNSVFFFLPMAGFIFDYYRRTPEQFKRNWLVARYFFYGAGVPATLHFLFAYLRFGSPFSMGYDLAHSQDLGVTWTSFQWDIAWGFLFGLGKGVLILAPALLLSFWGARKAFHHQAGFGWSCAIALAASVIFHGHILNNPDGSECWSVRYLMHLTSLLALPAWFGFQRFKNNELAKGATYIALAIGTFFSVLSLMAPNALEYTQNAAEGKPQKELLLSWSSGQLARRATNVSLKLSGETLEETVGNSVYRESVVRLGSEYMPNLWPWVLARKFPQATLWVWIAWLSIAVTCLRLGLKLNRALKPVELSAV